MSDFDKIIGDKEYSGSTIKPLQKTLQLTVNNRELNGYDIVKVVSASEQFMKERASSSFYRVHGNVNCISPTISVKKDATELVDLFVSGKGVDFKTLPEAFTIRLGYVSSLEEIAGTNGLYQEKITLITNPDELNFLPCGFSTNIFSDAVFNFVFNERFDISTLKTVINNVESLGNATKVEIPITDLVVYFEPYDNFTTTKFKAGVGAGYDLMDETEYGFMDSDIFSPTIAESSKTDLINTIRDHLSPNDTLLVADYGEKMYNKIYFIFERLNMKYSITNIILNKSFLKRFLHNDDDSGYDVVNGVRPSLDGGVTDGDVVLFDRETFEIKPVEKSSYFFTKRVIVNSNAKTMIDNYGLTHDVPLNDGRLPIDFRYRYNQHVKLPIRHFSSFTEFGDPTKVEGIPDYAIKGVDNSFIWRDLLTPGFIEPDSGAGVNYPFINGTHYIHTNIVLGVSPDMSHYNTFKMYYNYLFGFDVEAFRR
jgi:glutaredoxin-related protein